jgi:hypothetical protein
MEAAPGGEDNDAGSDRGFVLEEALVEVFVLV